MSNLKNLEMAISYKFTNEKLLRHALSHSSYANEKKLGKLGSNERLEFLGDAVLELISSEYFFEKYKEKPEGDLTKLRAKFVCEPALCYIANTLNLGSYLLLGKGENATGGRRRASLLSDALEAIIGAIYLDGGFANAKEFILKHILSDIEHKQFFYDSKTTLQEETQKLYNISPEYILLSESGPDHNKEFLVKVLINGEDFGEAKGSSKKNAEAEAALLALKKLGKV
jgi:ribonuclease III